MRKTERLTALKLPLKTTKTEGDSARSEKKVKKWIESE
jgi:hypothetical protein